MIFRVRRGLEANRTSFTPALGEPVFTTDTKKLYIGDGVTPGGIPVDTGGGGGGGGDGVDYVHRADTDNPHQVTKAQVGLSNVPNTDFTSAVAANTAKRTYPIADQQKLAALTPGATANATDAQLRDRLTHTGTQSISTVSGLQTALDNKQVAGDYATSADLTTSLTNKVDKVTGKGLSTEDYTTPEKSTVANAVTNTVTSENMAIPIFDGTTGKVLKPSYVTISDDSDLATSGYIESTFLVASPIVAADEIGEYYTDAGVSIDGVTLKDGIVNGRDVVADGLKLDAVEAGAQVNSVTSVNGQTGDVIVSGGGEGGGVTDHGLLTGLGDDDHTQYHNDTRGDARYYRKSEVDTQLSSKSPTSHNHDSLYSPLAHNHDGRYYTETETDTLLAAKQPTGDYATNTALAGKADSSHAHPIADIAATGTRSATTYLNGAGAFSTPTNTTYAIPTQAEAEAGTATTARAFSAQRVNQAIQALAPVKPVDLATKLDKTGGTVTGSLTVTGDIYSNGEKVVTENNLPAIPTIRTGWGYVQGNGSLTHASIAVSFGHTFSSVPVVVLTGIGYKDGSNPTSITDFGVFETPNPSVYGQTTSGFSVRVGNGGAIPANRRLGFSWIAIGT